MNTKSTLIKEIDNLSEPLMVEVLDFVRFLEHRNREGLETYIQSESSLKKEWLSSEEDKAWENL